MTASTDDTKGQLSQPTGRAQKRVPMKVRVFEDTRQKADYWAARRGYSSANEYAEAAIEEKIRRENEDYDLPTLEQKRLAQLIDEMSSLSANVENLRHVATTGFDSIIGLARGDNYLFDDEDGELATNGDQA